MGSAPDCYEKKYKNEGSGEGHEYENTFASTEKEVRDLVHDKIRSKFGEISGHLPSYDCKLEDAAENKFDFLGNEDNGDATDMIPSVATKFVEMYGFII
ncbi:hypothetical protein Aduo_002508 [Ancylostoma duodenale]